jgi:hypothetical protein
MISFPGRPYAESPSCCSAFPDDSPHLDGSRCLRRVYLLFGEESEVERCPGWEPTGHYMLVDFDVWYANGGWQVDWIEIDFIPMTREVTLSVRQYSTKEENVKNVVVNDDMMSLDLISSTGEVDRVHCEKGSGFHIIPDVKITRTVFNNKIRKTSRVEYAVADTITLPFNEISGLPPPGSLFFKEKK